MRRLAAALAVAALLGSACSREAEPAPGPTTSPTTASSTSASPTPSGDETGSAAAALERLCTIEPPNPGGGDTGVPPEGPTPPAIAEMMDELEQIRGFSFDHPVVAEPVTQEAIGQGFRESLDAAFPRDLSERRSLAWETIGVIGPGTDIREELAEYGGTQVIGYYDTLTEELVFLGGQEPSPLERVTLAHELTHAIDDQRFGLERLDALNARCRDDRTEGALALVEGNATYFMYQWARGFLSADEQIELAREAASQEQPASDVDPFVESLQLWPYTAGLAFVTALEQRGGIDAIDAAFGDLPVSSEQIVHPERYPDDVPTPLDIVDLADELGSGWRDLDVMEVGEVWLDTALALRLEASDAEDAAAGWDGGLYRAWTDGDGHVAIVLTTAWDSEADAEEFGSALQRWIEDDAADVLPVNGARTSAIFASDDATLRLLESASD